MNDMKQLTVLTEYQMNLSYRIHLYMSVLSSLFGEGAGDMTVGDPVTLVDKALWQSDNCYYIKSSFTCVMRAWDICRNRSAEE